MTRIPVGLLAEHLACAGHPIFAGAVQPDDWSRLRLDLETRGTSYAAVPLHKGGQLAGVVVFASALFRARLAQLPPAFYGQGEKAEQMAADSAAGWLLAIAHDPASGAAVFSDDFLRIATGEAEGATRGLWMGGKGS